MCKTYNTIGSLTVLKAHLDRNHIHDFRSLEDVLDFQHAYTGARQQLIAHHDHLTKQEQDRLYTDLQELDREIAAQQLQTETRLSEAIAQLKRQRSIVTAYHPTNFFKRLIKYIRLWYYTQQIRYRKRFFDFAVQRSTGQLTEIRQAKSDRYQFILSRFDEAVRESAQQPLSELDRKKTVLDELGSYIYGALGEQKVVKALAALPDEYFLINDFAVSFSKPIYNSQEHDVIHSIQIDHILVAPSGIFLIETKNWSERSMENPDLRSPVQQVRRASFILFKLLHKEDRHTYLRLDKHNWGDKRIPVKNLLVLMHTKPKETFQYVKVLTVNELPGYVHYFKPVFSNAETQSIADYLIKINKQKQL